ncbi:MAG: PilN domain-containing protein [Methylococcaceae bacterium]|nr:PilN domain-containing protein [Methylococcaceae bacterium]
MTLLVFNLATQWHRFWGWWLYELALLTPNWLRKLFSTPRELLFMRLHNFQVTFYRVLKGIEQPLASFYLHEEGKQAHLDFLKQHPEWQQATLILLLNARQLLKKRLDLPLATQENLAQVIGYELDRYTPFNGEQCYFTTQILGKNKARNRLALELMVISKAKLNGIIKELQYLGITADIMAHESDAQYYYSNAYTQQYNALPAEFRRKQTQNFKWTKRFLTLCFGMLAGIAIALPFWSQHQTLTKLQQQVAVAKHKALEIEGLQTETNTLLQAEKKIIRLKRQAPVILNVVEQLSKLFPKDTWLRSFEYTDNKFLLQGVSASSSALIGLLEKSPYFKKTTLVSPVTRNSEEKLDQFQLETHPESAHDLR